VFGALLRNARHIVRERLDKVLERAEARHPVLRTVSPLRAGSRRGGKRIQGVQGPSKARTRLDSRPAQSWVHALESSASAPVPTASTAGTASTSKPAVDAAPQPERAGAAHAQGRSETPEQETQLPSLKLPTPRLLHITRLQQVPKGAVDQFVQACDGASAPAARALPGLLPAGLSSLLHQELGRWQASLVRQAPPRSPWGMHQANAMPARRLQGTAARGERLAVAARLQPMLLLLLMRASLTHAGGIPAGRSEQVKL